MDLPLVSFLINKNDEKTNESKNVLAKFDNPPTPIDHDMAECAVCLEQFTEVRKAPITLNCGHNFCAICVRKLELLQFITPIRKLYSIVCPSCRQESMGSFTKNIMFTECLKKLGFLNEEDENLKYFFYFLTNFYT